MEHDREYVDNIRRFYREEIRRRINKEAPKVRQNFQIIQGGKGEKSKKKQ